MCDVLDSVIAMEIGLLDADKIEPLQVRATISWAHKYAVLYALMSAIPMYWTACLLWRWVYSTLTTSRAGRKSV